MTTCLIDMDDTLYEEREFVLSGFRAVADYCVEFGISSEIAWAFLRDRFLSEGRNQIFDALLEAHSIDASPDRIQKLVSVYREHKPEIKLYPGVADLLRTLRSKGKVVIVTDGLATVQARKVEALGLGPLVDQVVYCQAVGFPKPDPRSLDGIVMPGAADVVLVGDRPDHDLALAAHYGIASIRVRTGRFRNVDNAPWSPIADCATITEVPLCLLVSDKGRE